MGGWVAGALGLGGGSIFNPLLISMGVPPKVSSATGMYLVTFSKISACLIYYLSGELNIKYAIWISAWSTFGSLIGMQLTDIYMKRSGRQSIIVFFLTFVLFISVIGIPIFGYLEIKQDIDDGLNIWAFRTICNSNGH